MHSSYSKICKHNTVSLHLTSSPFYQERLISRYVVEEIMPLSTVDSQAFRAIIHRIPTTVNSKLPHREAFSAYLEKEYAEMERNLKASLNDVNFVSTTADIWTANANNKSYMGVTLHWIHRSTLERNKAALACRRIRGRHTYDVIGAEIENIHSSYGLLNKVVATVTYNGSNFVKAFKEESTRTDDDDVTSLNLKSSQCASHTINIISTSDVEKYLTSHAESKAVYRSSIAKCTVLCTKSNRSTLASEAVEEVSKRKLLVPTSTRWNSFFDAVKRVAEIPMSDLNTLCSKLGVKCFIDREYQFLHEYCTIMKPLTAALDILQGDCVTHGELRLFCFYFCFIVFCMCVVLFAFSLGADVAHGKFKIVFVFIFAL
uniref:HAT C-terminal dimerisation domain-containing protein n=1 Tax=Kryptolebias marmoratus TaxID=37003 RepID=A0A3Q2ZPS5_KRYMA